MAAENKNISKLGRINEFTYAENAEGNMSVDCYALSGREFDAYEFEDCFSKRIGGDSALLTSTPTNPEHEELSENLESED